jgi:hypothetical protein
MVLALSHIYEVPIKIAVCQSVNTLHSDQQVVTRLNPLTPNDLYRRRALSPLKIKIPSKNMRIKQIHQLFIQFINCVW